MELKVVNLNMLTTIPEVSITHDGQQLVFNVSSFGRGSFKNFDVFEHLNKYLATLPKQKVDDLFNLYAKLRYVFDNSFMGHSQDDQIAVTLTAIVDHLGGDQFENLKDWIVFKSDIIIPSRFEQEFVYSVDNNNSREGTYVRQDYTRLVAMSIMMRLALPVWGEFISRTKQYAGTVFKEYYAFLLIRDSWIVQSDAMNKLRIYIDKTVGSGANNMATILNGVSSEHFPTWILGLVVVRRLSLGDIRGNDPNANLVTFIFAFVKQKTAGAESNGKDIIKEKTFSDSNANTDAQLSTLERYKIKTNISIGEICGMEHAVRDPWAVANKLTSKMTKELFNDSMASCKMLNTKTLTDPQMTILRWVMKPVISPRGLMHLPKSTICECLGVCQAVLWARGHRYLALLVTSYADMANDDMYISGVDSRARIPKDMVEDLNIMYPYFKRTGNKKTQIKPVNTAMHAIDQVVDDLALGVWNMTASNRLITAHFEAGHNRRIPIVHSIRVDLATLVIEVAKRNWI